MSSCLPRNSASLALSPEESKKEDGERWKRASGSGDELQAEAAGLFSFYSLEYVPCKVDRVSQLTQVNSQLGSRLDSSQIL